MSTTNNNYIAIPPEDLCPFCYENFCTCGTQTHSYPLIIENNSAAESLSEEFHKRCKLSTEVHEPAIAIPDGEVDIDSFLKEMEDILGEETDSSDSDNESGMASDEAMDDEDQ
ncbi:hypothetical protein DFQ27_002634 [Actinomortierella ambigua]|uniref:Uncharacterized protein n=1 Tax=Actinomortierella ambigua TaxID=1343610 RepID=A0A9P6UCW5_9FUNG|nr:hypothetical protein DFQ27_002634 [Actinomortierella ambigua]